MSEKGVEQKPKGWIFKLGVVLLFVSAWLWVAAAVVPFTHLEVGLKVGAVTVILIAAEVLFWLGTVCAGKGFIDRIKALYSYENWKNRHNKNNTDS